jgi:hypothetical protein
MRGSQAAGSQVSPSATQVPQLGLQQTWPTLQVLRPQAKLTGSCIRGSQGV